MKKVFVLLALVAMAGCSNMHWPGRSSSSGTTGSSSMGSSSMSSSGTSSSGMSSSYSGVTAMPGTDAYTDYSKGTYNPATGLPVPAGP